MTWTQIIGAAILAIPIIGAFAAPFFILGWRGGLFVLVSTVAILAMVLLGAYLLINPTP